MTKIDDIAHKCPDGHTMIRDYPNTRVEWICPVCGYMEIYKKAEDVGEVRMTDEDRFKEMGCLIEMDDYEDYWFDWG